MHTITLFERSHYLHFADEAPINTLTEYKASLIITNVTHARARKRRLIVLVSLSTLIVGALAGCGDPVESQRNELIRHGYSNVKIVDAKNTPYTFSATVNDCTVHLFISQDKEVWIARIDRTANGMTLEEQFYPPGVGVFEAVSNEQELRQNQHFTAICP